MVQQSNANINEGSIPVSVSHTSDSKGKPVTTAQLPGGNYSTINYACKTAEQVYQQIPVTKDGTFVCPHGRVVNLNGKNNSSFKLPTFKKISYRKSQSCLIGCMKFFHKQCHERKKPDSQIMYVHDDVTAAMKQLKCDVERFSQFERNNCMFKIAKIDGENAKTILSRMSIKIYEIEERLLKNDIPTCSEILVKKENILNLIRSLQQCIGSFLDDEVQALKERQTKFCNLLKFLLNIEKEFQCITRSIGQQCCNKNEVNTMPKLTNSHLSSSFHDSSLKPIAATSSNRATLIDQSKHISLDVKSPRVAKKVTVINDSKEIPFESSRKDSSTHKVYNISYELKNTSFDLSGIKNSTAPIRNSLINESKNILIDESVVKNVTATNNTIINETKNISLDEPVVKNATESNRDVLIKESKYNSLDESVVKNATESNRDSPINESKNISLDNPVVVKNVKELSKCSLIDESGTKDETTLKRVSLNDSLKYSPVNESFTNNATASKKANLIDESKNISIDESSTINETALKKFSLIDVLKYFSFDESGKNIVKGSKKGSEIDESKNILHDESVIKNETGTKRGIQINESKNISIDESIVKSTTGSKRSSKNFSIDESSTKNSTTLKRVNLINKLNYISADECGTNNGISSKEIQVDESKNISIDESITKNSTGLKRFSLIDTLKHFPFDESCTNNVTGLKKGSLIDELKNITHDESISKNEFDSKRKFLRGLLNRQRYIERHDKAVNFDPSLSLCKEQCHCFKKSINATSEPSSLNNDVTSGYKLKSNLTGADLVYKKSRLSQLNLSRSCRTLNRSHGVIIDEKLFCRIPSQDRGDIIREVSHHSNIDSCQYRSLEPSDRIYEINNIWYESARQLLDSPYVPHY